MPKILTKNGTWWFLCPACKRAHYADTRFPFNYNHEYPTFGRPFLYKSEKRGGICHFTIYEGKIRYDVDSTHAMRGQWMELPDWNEVTWTEQREEVMAMNAKKGTKSGKGNKGGDKC